MEPLNEFVIKDEQVFSGALSCRGCGWSLLVRHLSNILGKETVYVLPASCFSIISGPYPLNELKGNVIHTLFAAAPATATGIRAVLDRQGREDVTVAVLAGDGGTFDIGIQSLSGAATRCENILYICNNNGAYMNTGIQSSTATPYAAITTTNPVVKIKDIWPKDLMGIIAAHNIPYAATASLAYMADFRNKIKIAKQTDGFRLLMIDGPCPPGHKTEPEMSISVSRLSVETNIFPLFEVEHQKYTISYFPKKFVPVEKCMKLQGRYRHLFKNGSTEIIQKIQEYTNLNWIRLNNLAENNVD